jgi:AraC-like DNA-binding protein
MSIIPDDPDPAARLREGLAGWLDGLARGAVPLQVAPPGEIRSEGRGHFHLAPELFLQVAGSTRFHFPDGAATLQPGQALLLPPRLLHAERVRPGERREPFCNLVVYAEGDSLSCHLAREVEPGRPGIAHLEARRHPQAARIHDWLADAARLAPATADPLAAAQARALVTAAAAGVLRALDEPDGAAAEPPLIARLRVLVQNRLGDSALSVAELARHSGCTPDHLSAVFRRRTGEHLVAWITRLRMERAARLLRETPMAVKEVAWACGYASPSYFIRCFRSRHGCTPQAFRAAGRA